MKKTLHQLTIILLAAFFVAFWNGAAHAQLVNVIRINSGGGAQNFGGEAWVADQYFTGGTAYSTASAISNTTQDQIYQTERFGNVSYAIPVSNAGIYAVDLHLAEIYFNTTGSRVFNINIENGQFVRNNLDLIQTIGSINQAYVLRADNLNITDGTINITFTGVTDNAKISGISIGRYNDTSPVVSNPIPDHTAIIGELFSYNIPANTFSTPDPESTITYTASLSGGGALPAWLSFNSTTRNFSGTPAAGNVGAINVQVTATDEVGGNVSDIFQLTVASGFYRAININGAALTIDGNSWSASTGAANFNFSQTNGGTFSNQSITLNPSTDANSATMIRSSVYGSTVNVNFTSVPNGTYDVSIYVWEDDVPQTYSLSIEGTVAQSGYNSGSPGTWSKLGPFRRTVTDGAINISTTGGHANISGVDIRRASSGEVLVSSVSVSPTAITLAAGQGVRLNKTVTPANASNLNVTWSSSNTSVATVDANGFVRAIAQGSATITATSVEGGHTGSASIAVQSVGSNVLANPEFDSGLDHWTVGDWTGTPANTLQVVQGAELSGTNSLHVNVNNNNNGTWMFQVKTPLSFRLETGRTYRISYLAKAETARQITVALHGEGSNSDYWSVNQSLTTTVQRFSYTYTPGAGQTGLSSDPSFTIAFYLARGVISDIWLDNVRVEDITGISAVTNLTLSPASISLNISQTTQLTKTFTPSNATNQGVTWSSRNPAIATVDNDGLVTAIALGSAVINAYSTNGGFIATATIDVTGIPVTAVTLSPTNLLLAPSQTGQLTKTISPANATDQNVVWSSNNTSVASVDANGMVTAVAPGTATITATASGGITNNATVTVAIPVAGVTLSPTELSLEVGQTGQLTHTVSPSNATNQDVTWTSSNTSVATIDNNGVVSAIEQGSTIITVATNSGNFTATSSIAVTLPVSGINVSPTSLNLVQGQVGQLTHTILPPNASNQNVTWSSSDTNIVTVSNTGAVTAIAVGAAIITVATEDGLFNASATINVLNGQLATGYVVAWNNILGAVDQSSVLTKTVATGWDNAGATSENQLPANQNGWIEFKIDNTNSGGTYLIGFSTLDNSFLRTAIEYGLEIRPQDQRVFVHESSEEGSDLTNWTLGDVFRISRDGTTINYYKNGGEIKSVTVDANKAYKVKALINSGKTYPAVSSFWIPASRGQIPDAWEFAALKDLYDLSGGPSWTNKTGWGGPNNWATNITAAQMDAWFGITVGSGDITRIELRSNNLTGNLPSSIGRLTSLRWLLIDTNNLTGDLPATMGSLIRMENLYLYKNNFSGNFDWIGNMPNMLQFYFLENPNLDCSIPPTIGNLTKMTRFIGGGFVADKTYIQTKLHGPIPASIANCTKLEYLYLDNSQLSGPIPSLINLVNLKVLSLFNNPLLSGQLFVPSGARFLSLYVFNTNISGSIPVFNGVDLAGLDLSNSLVRGNIPSFSTSPNTEWLGFDSMELTHIPNWGTSFSNLRYLSVKNNLLTSIPNFSAHANKANLELYVQNNKLDFVSIEANFTSSGIHPYKIFQYSPQQNPIPPPANVTVQLNAELKIEAPNGGVHGVYLWEKLVNETWTNITAQNQSTVPNQFIRTNSSTDDNGTYRYTVSNTWVPGLTFESGPIQILIPDDVTTSVKAMYNGLITSVRWRTDEAFDTDEGNYTGMYLYDYDDKYQIKNASWAAPDFLLNSYVSEGNKFQLAGMEYDPNGNIKKLRRYNADGVPTHNFSYHYKYQNDPTDHMTPREFNNQLQSVEGYVSEYTYNKIGQMIGEDKSDGDENDQYVEYDVTGKVTKVFNKESKLPADLKVENLYDDRGFRLAKINYVTQRTTWYIRDASGNIISIYEQVGTPTGLETELEWSTLSNIETTSEGGFQLTEGASNGVAKSSNRLTVNDRGTVEYRIEDTNLLRSFGFQVVGQNSLHRYSVQFSGGQMTGSVSNAASFGSANFSYSQGDVIKVIRADNAVQFYKNDSYIMAFSIGSNALEVFIELNEPGAKFSNLSFKMTVNDGKPLPLNQTEVPIYGAGKLGTYYPYQDGSTNFEITDHLGNVRALIRDNISIYLATLEDNEQQNETNPRFEETAYFQNIDETVVNDYRMNHTPDGSFGVASKAAYLFWNDTQGTLADEKSIGPAIALRVQAGDSLKIETWSRFERKNDYTHDFGLVALSALLGNTFAASGGFEGFTVNNTITNLEGALTAGAFPDDGGDDTRPFAYLNYIVYDENMTYQSAGWRRVSDDAGFYPNEIGLPEKKPVHVAFEEPVEINTNGYIYVWVSNQSKETRVWFDDLKVTHAQNIVVQATDYGVWGDVLREQKTDESIYRYGYQGQFAEKDEETGWNHFELREYDPVIGRWLVPDPARQYPSPYVAYGNDPINKVDPDGGCDTGDCSDGWGPSPESLKFQLYLTHIRAEATSGPGILSSMWEATKDFSGDLITGEIFSKAWEGVSNYATDYPTSMLNNLDYQMKLGNGEIPGNQIAYDLTYGGLSFATARSIPKVLGAGWSTVGRMAYSSKTIGIGSSLFGIGRNGMPHGILNSGTLRAGWGYMKAGNQHVFRIGIGNNPRFYPPTTVFGKGIHWHVNVFSVPATF